jgi:hypothetical protein
MGENSNLKGKKMERNKERIMNQSAMSLFGWSAYANGILTLANMVTLALMFGVSMSWGRVNDAISVLWLLSFLPLVLLLVQVNQLVMGRAVAVGTAIVGASGILAFAVLQSLLVVGQVRFEQTFAAVATLGGVLGLWLVLNGLLALMGKTLPGGLAWLGIGFGLSYILGTIGYWLGGYESPVLWVGAAAGYLFGPVWAFWLGRLLLNGRLVPVAALTSGG